MLKTKLLASAIAIGFSFNTWAGCDKPDAPAIPDAQTTVTAEMVKAQNDVKQFIAAAESYLKCNKNTTRHNDMVAEMQAVGDEFNEAIRAFKERMSKA